MDPLVTSTLISSGSQLVGGLFGGKQKKGPDLDDQSAAAHRDRKKIWRDELPMKMAAAKAAGIHPTVALGIPSTSGGGFSVGGDSVEPNLADTANEIGQNIGSAVSRIQTPDERAFSAITAKQAVERGDLENEYLKTQIAHLRATPVPSVYNGGPQGIPGQAQTGAPSKGLSAALATVPVNKLGYRDDRQPLHTLGVDEKGDVFRVYNDDLGDNELAQAAHFFRYTMPDYSHNQARRLSKWISDGVKKLSLPPRNRSHQNYTQRKGG